ncbi:RHS repeat domain-containing protein [Methylocystis parvus]|uniref:RHS repeat-associated core domain-containing protein n=1 Tax=Methylocystis parvus TaxID=134 RepID=A0A6B8MCL4_9HYPH|nr:RHS repeat-associated core domain-containing protein [Methylocystis parvus]QGM98390.1 RHS repeat-associated core domain-containing protein [Methylocystis parvus]WBK01279.1 RHS repeat-associated core domain-containing protein [Methylocystis parvus OBBP]
MSFEYDVEGRLSKAYQTNAPSQGAVYAYDAQDRLASRTVTSGATTTTTLYIHDLDNHVIAETDAAGVTKREYIWLNDIPIAVIDGADTATPTMYSVHTDHLGRPARMVAQNWASVWDVIYSPFGGVAAIFDSTIKLDMRFPGQWFQMESGLAYNWHRHYDASLGRYVQPDPIGYAGGRSLYGYVGQNPLAYIDPDGLIIQWPPKIGIDWDDIQKDLDHNNYHRICDRREPPGLSPCASARWRYRQALVCYQRRVEWEERWGDAKTRAIHEPALEQVKQRMKNAADDIKRYCNSQVCPPSSPED